MRLDTIKTQSSQFAAPCTSRRDEGSVTSRHNATWVLRLSCGDRSAVHTKAVVQPEKAMMLLQIRDGCIPAFRDFRRIGILPFALQ